jgi:hypothetical protein
MIMNIKTRRTKGNNVIEERQHELLPPQSKIRRPGKVYPVPNDTYLKDGSTRNGSPMTI